MSQSRLAGRALPFRGSWRGRWKPLLLGLVAIAIACVILFEISRARCFALVGEAICRVETTQPVVALTFDDGPTPEGVAAAMTALAVTGAHATFFLIGEQIPGKEALVRRLLAEAHEVGNHSFSHQHMVFHLPSFYEDEVMRTDALLRQAGVPAPHLFRPPYGKKLIGLPNALARHDYRMIMWDVEGPDGATTPQDYAAAILGEVRPGSIILMHIMYRANRVARDALPLVLAGLRRRGYQVVTVGALLSGHG